MCGKDHPRDEEPIPGAFGNRDHSSAISLTGRLRGQGLVHECEKATGVGGTHGPSVGDWIQVLANSPVGPVLRSQFHQQQHSFHEGPLESVQTISSFLIPRERIRNYFPWQTFHTPRPRALDDQSQTAKLMGYGSPGGQEKQLWPSHRTALPSPGIRAQGARVSDRPE